MRSLVAGLQKVLEVIDTDTFKPWLQCSTIKPQPGCMHDFGELLRPAAVFKRNVGTCQDLSTQQLSRYTRIPGARHQSRRGHVVPPGR